MAQLDEVLDFIILSTLVFFQDNLLKCHGRGPYLSFKILNPLPFLLTPIPSAYRASQTTSNGLFSMTKVEEKFKMESISIDIVRSLWKTEEIGLERTTN